MKVLRVAIRNFRRLENVEIGFENGETVFVGPNNSGKTSATAIFRAFLSSRGFRIHDFSVAKILAINAFGVNGGVTQLPSIELDIWFSIDPATIEFGRAYSLLPNLSGNFDRVGIRLSYGASDAAALQEKFRQAYPVVDGDQPAKSLSDFLGQDNNLNRFFETRFFALQETDDGGAAEAVETDAPVAGNDAGVAAPGAAPATVAPIAGADTTTEEPAVGGCQLVGASAQINIEAKQLDKQEGKALLQALLRVDFIDAQRNIDDEEANRSTKLSTAFASFYRKNLEQADVAADAHAVIDRHNEELTSHYDKQFSGLMTLIKGLGVPAINDRDLKIISSLSPADALQGNTELLYVDPDRGHRLPELYNGLGFKNLIYMAVQARHFHSQWARTEQSRPLCQLIFIEEPEVHLHAQVQQVFISNILKVLEASAAEEKTPDLVPQLIITTHSSHILEAVEFEKVRYFRRCALNDEAASAAEPLATATEVAVSEVIESDIEGEAAAVEQTPGEPAQEAAIGDAIESVTHAVAVSMVASAKAGGILSASQVHSLRDFRPGPVTVKGQEATEAEALDFLRRYLRLTHCDLFFADAAILVEGAVEKLLLPSMIAQDAKLLTRSYLTILEVGGAYAHRFASLMEFLCVPYLIITDLDSVDPAANHSVCRADLPTARSSNATLKELLGLKKVADLVTLGLQDREDAEKRRFIAFQGDIDVSEGGATMAMRPRTLEEAIAYQNFALLRSGDITLGCVIPEPLGDAYDAVFKQVRSAGFKKTDFAMSLLAAKKAWQTPAYIAQGLEWLEARLHGDEEATA